MYRLIIFGFISSLYFNCGVILKTPDKELPPIPPSDTTITDYPSRLLLVRGTMTLSGDKVKKVLPLEYFENIHKLTEPFPNRKSGLFEVYLQFKDGGAQHVFFSAEIINDKDIINHGFFQLYIPISKPLEVLQIRRTKNQEILYEFDKKDF